MKTFGMIKGAEMKSTKQAEAFQCGLDSYYEAWDGSKIALVKWGYQQEDGDDVVAEFDAGRACAESDDEVDQLPEGLK